MNTLFIAPYSFENICLGQCFFSKNSIQIYWNNDLLFQSKNNFYNLFGSPEFCSHSLLLSSDWDNPTCFTELREVIRESKFEPDILIARGETNQLWPIKALKESKELNIPYVAILDRLSNPITEFDIEVLDAFDQIYAMGPSCYIDETYDKTIPIFKKFESYSFVVEPPIIDLSNLRVNVPLILCNNDNYEEILKTDKTEKSVINIEKCPFDELIPYIYLSKILINETKEPEFDLILKKMNRNSISLKELNKANAYNEYSKENIEEFCDFLKKNIFKYCVKIKEKQIETEEIKIDI